MKTKILLTLLVLTVALHAVPPTRISLPGDAKSSIASGVALPAGRALFWTSGTVPSPINKDGKTIYERYGDTYQQGVSALKAIEEVLATEGLTMKTSSTCVCT